MLLDDAPRSARVVVDGVSRDVDLGSHRGLTLEGEVDAPGAREEAAVVYTSALAGTPLGAVLTHANLLSNARATVNAAEHAIGDDSRARGAARSRTCSASWSRAPRRFSPAAA